MSKEEVQTRLLKLSNQIKLAEDQLVANKQGVAEEVLIYENESTALMNLIGEEVDLAGKAIYSNDVKRKAEFARRLSNGHPLSKMKKGIDNKELSNKLKENEISFMKREIKIAEIMSRL